MGTKQCKVLVADDHAVVRKGIVQILQDSGDLCVDGEAATGTEVLELIRQRAWDALIMDLHMPGLSGIDLLKQVHAIRPGLPVLVLTVQPEDLYARRLLHAGAAGFANKDSVVSELVGAVRRICNGGRFISQSLAEQIAFSTGADIERPPHEQLSDREFEVLRLLASGLTVTEIGEKLCLSIKTVSTYRTRILQKMHMKTNAELAKYAVHAKLVE